MQVRVLGSLRVASDDGATVAPRGERAREVLAVLVAHGGRPVPARVLLDLVWRDAAHGLTVSTVHTVLARLRRQFGDGLVTTTDAGYALTPGVGTDAAIFTDLANAVHAPDLAGRRTDRRELCRSALALWTGPLAYEGVRDDLVVTERTRLEELHRRVRTDLAACLQEAGADRGLLEESSAVAKGLLADNPLDEGAAVLAMRASYRLHRQAEALAVFDAVRRALREELGVGPSPATSAEHDRVLAQEDTPTPWARPALRSPRAVPAPTSPTIGRERDIATVLAALEEGHRLVTVTGPGGVGKSRVLAEVGAALADSDVVHVALGAHEGLDTDALASALAVAGGISLGGAGRLQDLVAALRTADLTVVADEAEWVLEPAGSVATALLEGCPRLRLVLSSRVPLAVLGERVVVLDPLPTADPDGDLAAISASPAVRLLTERLTDRGSPALPPGAHREAQLRALAVAARRVDGLPLALELVAGAMASAPGASALDVVGSPLDLEDPHPGRAQRQQSLRHTLDWSLARLSPGARTALRRLSVFVGPFTAAAARAVVGEDPVRVDEAVRELARHNVLAVDRTSGVMSFRMLRTVRDKAAEDLAATSEVDHARTRHHRWFAGLWRDAPLSDALIEQVGRTYEDQVEALANAVSAGDTPAAADIATALCRRWQFVESGEPGLRWTEVLLALPDLEDQARARLLVARAGFLQHADWSPVEQQDLVSALADDPDWRCDLHLMASLTAYASGDRGTARQHLDECVALASTLVPHHLAEIVASRAATDAADGLWDEAVAGAHEALALVGTTSSAVQLVTVVPKVGLALLEAGRSREALDLLTAAAEECSERFGIPPTSTTAMNAGWAALGAGEASVGLDWFGRALVGPQAAVAPSAVGEAAVGAGASAVAADLDPDAAAELLGLGLWLLDSADEQLPPSLARHVDSAVSSVGDPRPPAHWSTALASVRVTQVVGRLLS